MLSLVEKGGLPCTYFSDTTVSVAPFQPCKVICRADLEQGLIRFIPVRLQMKRCVEPTV